MIHNERSIVATRVGSNYSASTESISWLLMPWLLPSPGHQHLWCWLCGIRELLSYSWKILTTCIMSLWKNGMNYIYIFMFPMKHLARFRGDKRRNPFTNCHYDDVTMGAIASQITSLTIVYSTVYSGADQSKHQTSASLAFVWGIHRGPVNSPHKWPVTRKMFPFDDVIMLPMHQFRE